LFCYCCCCRRSRRSRRTARSRSGTRSSRAIRCLRHAVLMVCPTRIGAQHLATTNFRGLNHDKLAALARAAHHQPAQRQRRSPSERASSVFWRKDNFQTFHKSRPHLIAINCFAAANKVRKVLFHCFLNTPDLSDFPMQGQVPVGIRTRFGHDVTDSTLPNASF
jgi:hypothetical protein